MRTLDHRTPSQPRRARRWRILALTVPLSIAAGCAASDDTTQVTDATQPAARTSPSSEPATTDTNSDDEPGSTSSSTPAPSSTTPDANTTTAPAPSSTTPATSASTSTPSPSPSTTTIPQRPEQSIPRAVRGTWRISNGDTVTAEECETNSNFGQVLTVRADGYSFFEAGGVLIEVIERDESRIDAMFETTAGGPNTSVERITLDAQDAGNVLIVNDAQPGVIRLVRCPPPGSSAVTGSDPGTLELEPFDLARVRKAGIESIGCTIRPGEANDPDPVFFANGDGGFMVIDGESITLANTTSPDLGVIPDLEADLTFSQNGYAATFVTVGAAEPTSIESTQQGVTLAVATPDGRRTRIDGIASCGV